MSQLRSISITRRLVVTVLVLELMTAIALIGAITVHERRVQLQAFDATLMGTAQSLMGAVGDAEDANDDIMLEMRGLRLRRDSIYRVVDEHGRVLGSAGSVPTLRMARRIPLFEISMLRIADIGLLRCTACASLILDCLTAEFGTK